MSYDEASFHFNTAFGEERGISPVLHLQQAVLNEKGSPEILEFKQELVDNVSQALGQQESLVDTLETNAEADLARLMYTMENRRVKYLLKTYLRVRLKKIERFASHLLNNATLLDKLSQAEKTFTESYFMAIATHLKVTVLNHLPEAFSGLVKESELSETKDMIPEPNLQSYVFCQVVEDCGNVQVDDEGSTIDFRRDDLLAVRYDCVAQLLADERIKLL